MESGRTLKVKRQKVDVVTFCRTLDAKPGIGRTLAHQLLRSGTSVGANVEEAQAGQSQADFISKYSIALKEARETIYWLRLLEAAGYSTDGQCRAIQKEADEIARIIGSIIVRTKSKK